MLRFSKRAGRDRCPQRRPLNFLSVPGLTKIKANDVRLYKPLANTDSRLVRERL